MNCYDFDKTIYDGDSTVDFYKYCIRHYPAVLISAPATIAAAIPFGLKILEKTRFKQVFYRFLRHIPDVDKAVADFWKQHSRNIKGWYYDQKREDDLIISASPEFLLRPICAELGIALMASRVDSKTGLYTGVNCHGEEKVRRLNQSYPDAHIEEFYSDSYSDQPLAKVADKAYMVFGNRIEEWKFR